MASDEEDDYMSMVIEDPQGKIKESSIQRAARLKKEVGELITQRPKAQELIKMF